MNFFTLFYVKCENINVEKKHLSGQWCRSAVTLFTVQHRNESCLICCIEKCDQLFSPLARSNMAARRFPLITTHFVSEAVCVYFVCVCVQQEGDSLGAMEKVCRQLTYHLSPHSQWRRQGLLKRKPQAWWVCITWLLWLQRQHCEDEFYCEDIFVKFGNFGILKTFWHI